MVRGWGSEGCSSPSDAGGAGEHENTGGGGGTLRMEEWQSHAAVERKVPVVLMDVAELPEASVTSCCGVWGVGCVI